MKIASELTDEAVLQELGARLARLRIERNLTQAALAEQAGVSKRTLERLEAGAVATQLSGFLRVCRSLGVLEAFETVLPSTAPGPMARLRHGPRQRKRASGRRAAGSSDEPWSWGEPP